MQEQLKPYTSNQYIKTQTMLHLMFLGAMLGFAMVVSALTNSWQILWNFAEEPFFFVVPLVAVAGIFISKFLYQKQLEAVKALPTLKEKLGQYQTATLIKYAFLEAPALLALVVFLNTENALFLIIALILIMYFFLQKPNKEIIETNLNLNSEMRQLFRRGDQIIH